MQDPSLSPGTKPNWIGKILKVIPEIRNNIKAVGRGDAAIQDLLPNSNYLKRLNSLPIPKEIEYVCLVGKVAIPSPPYISDTDGVVTGYSQRAEKLLPRLHPNDPIVIEQKIPWDYIIDMPCIEHTQETKQYDKIFKALDGKPDAPDKKDKYSDTPKITLGTYTFTPDSPTGTVLYYNGSANNFYITGKIYDYLPGSCTISVEINNPGNYIIKDKPVSALNMNTESQEVGTNTATPTRFNAKFNFKPNVSLSQGIHTFRLTVTNPGNLTATATTKNGSDWIPFRITENLVEVPVQKSASPAAPIAGGMQAASSLYFWDNQGNRWENRINSNLRVDSDNFIRYNYAGNVDNPNLRHRVYLESRIYPAGSNQPKASCVNKKEMQAITYTFASQPFALLPFTKDDGTVVYRPDVNDDGTITYPADFVVFSNNEVVFTPKKDTYPNLNWSFANLVIGFSGYNG